MRNSVLRALAFDSPLKFFGFRALASLFDGSERDTTWPDSVIDIADRPGRATAGAPRFTLH